MEIVQPDKKNLYIQSVQCRVLYAHPARHTYAIGTGKEIFYPSRKRTFVIGRNPRVRALAVIHPYAVTHIPYISYPLESAQRIRQLAFRNYRGIACYRYARAHAYTLLLKTLEASNSWNRNRLAVASEVLRYNNATRRRSSSPKRIERETRAAHRLYSPDICRLVKSSSLAAVSLSHSVYYIPEE